MRKAIAIGMLGLALFSNRAAAQTAVEKAAILRDFQRSVVDYSERHKSLAMFPEAMNAATPAPKIFTLPVAMVFRQLIADAVAPPARTAAVSGVAAAHRVEVSTPFPLEDVAAFPAALRDALPALPDGLEYRLVDHDLVIRDAHADVIVAVLRDAVGGPITTAKQ